MEWVDTNPQGLARKLANGK